MIWTTEHIVIMALIMSLIAFSVVFRSGIFALLAFPLTLMLIVESNDNLMRTFFIGLAIVNLILTFARRELQD